MLTNARTNCVVNFQNKKTWFLLNAGPSWCSFLPTLFLWTEIPNINCICIWRRWPISPTPMIIIIVMIIVLIQGDHHHRHHHHHHHNHHHHHHHHCDDHYSHSGRLNKLHWIGLDWMGCASMAETYANCRRKCMLLLLDMKTNKYIENYSFWNTNMSFI